MNKATIIGLLAAVCTTSALVPQAFKVYKSQKTEDLSLVMYAVFSLGLLLWLVYGLLIKDMPVIAANIVTLIFSLYILWMKIKHG